MKWAFTSSSVASQDCILLLKYWEKGPKTVLSQYSLKYMWYDSKDWNWALTLPLIVWRLKVLTQICWFYLLLDVIRTFKRLVVNFNASRVKNSAGLSFSFHGLLWA